MPAEPVAAADDVGPARPTTRLTRATLVLAAVLTTTAFVQLYVFSTETDRWFAWTIDEPMSAAVLGSFYLTSTVTVLFSLRPREWALARIAFPSIVVFIWGTLLVTVLHWDKFHFDDGPTSAKIAAWAWLVVYVVDPVLVTVVWIVQARRPGPDPPAQRPLPAPYRGLLMAGTAAFTFLGAVLFLAPDWTADWWPWAITPLTARAMACWILALAVLFVTMLHDDDVDRVRPGSAPFVVLALLLLGALVRFWDHLSGAGRWVYLVGLVGLALVSMPTRFRRPAREP